MSGSIKKLLLTKACARAIPGETPTPENLFSEPRKEYLKLIEDQTYLGSLLSKGAEKARDLSSPYLQKIKSVVGIGSLI